LHSENLIRIYVILEAFGGLSRAIYDVEFKYFGFTRLIARSGAFAN